MVQADFTSSYLDAENAQENDLITISGKPTTEEKTNTRGQKYNSTNIPVQINGKDKLFSPSKETGKRFVKAWGSEMDNWVNKKATIKHVLKQIKGSTKAYIEAFPIEEKV